jgi:hypothetical protein
MSESIRPAPLWNYPSVAALTAGSGGATGIQDPITGVRAATAILTVANAGVVWQYDSASGDFVTV